MAEPLRPEADFLNDYSFVEYFLSGTDKDGDFWESYLESHPQDHQAYHQAWEILSLMNAELPQELVETKLTSFKKLFNEHQANLNQHPRWWVTPKLFSIYAIASCLAFFIWFSQFFPLTNVPAVDRYQNIQGQIISSLEGTRKMVTLTDGSQVTLYPGSTLRISDDFNHTDRKIAITGQVYIEVAKNAKKPFTVYCCQISNLPYGLQPYLPLHIHWESSV